LNAARTRGFTLIEMVIAFAILAVTLAALYSTFETALSRSRHDARLSEAILLAQSLLARAGTEWPLANGNERGAWNSYTYQVSEQTVASIAGQRLRTLPTIRVTASVTWAESAGRRNIALSTLKFLPSVAP
jgi:general secretion pathway protein I